MTKAAYDVTVIGAGMAGLTAARALAEAGQKILVIEAQNRIGGRIWTQHIGGETIELGAEFIHGRPPELWALINEAAIVTFERDGAQACFEDGVLSDCGSEIGDAIDSLEALEDFTGPDISFAEYLERRKVPIEHRAASIGYVEGFNAADHREISVMALGVQQKAEDAIGTDHNFHIRGGYSQLPEYLAKRIQEHSGTILLGSPVSEIRWQPDRVQVITQSGEFSSAKAVITLPLAVLQNGSVSISPAPDPILEAAKLLRMGHARRFTLLFRERFWERLPPQPTLKELSFLFTFSEMPPVWWTPHPERSNALTGWVGGPRTEALTGLNNTQLSGLACRTLGKIFRIDEAEIRQLTTGCYSHDWRHDPYTLGAYSYVAAGGLDASRQMTQPLDATLFFAGEHTDVTGHWGTVHAAMRSGLRAAEQVLDAS